MEEAEASDYKVKFTPTSRIYFYEVVEYLYGSMTLERAEAVSSHLLETALSLNVLYSRGSLEQHLLYVNKSIGTCFLRGARENILR